MAQDIVGSLFGLNPNAIYGQQMDTEMNQAINFANLSPAQQANYGGFLAGQMLGRGIASLLGAEDPRLQQAKVIQEAQQQGFDTTTPEGLQQMAQFFVQRGQPGLASQVAQQMQGMRTAATEEQYKQAQAYAAIKKADAEKLSNIARMIQESGIDINSPEGQTLMRRAVMADIEGKAKGQGTTVNLGGLVDKVFNKATAEKEGEEAGKQITSWGKVTANAPQSLQTANTALDLIDRSFTGAGAESLKNLSKFARQMGVPVSDKASNTEISVALTKKLISEQGRTFPGSQSNLELQQILEKNPNALQEPRTQRYLWNLYKQDVRTASESYKAAQAHKKQAGSYAGFDIYQGGSQASQSVINKTNRYTELENQLNTMIKNKQPIPPALAAEAKQLESEGYGK